MTDATPQPAAPATDAAPPILTVEAVTKTYGEGHTAVTAVHEASMRSARASSSPCWVPRARARPR